VDFPFNVSKPGTATTTIAIHQPPQLICLTANLV
jgi:hypothetical protein